MWRRPLPLCPFVSSSRQSISERERTTLDSWLRLVARGFIRWSTFQKLKTKIFFEKKPLYWRASNKRDTFRENKKLQKPEDFEEVIEDIWRSIPKKGILNEKMDLNILISQLNHDVQNEMKVSLKFLCQKTLNRTSSPNFGDRRRFDQLFYGFLKYLNDIRSVIIGRNGYPMIFICLFNMNFISQFEFIFRLTR